MEFQFQCGAIGSQKHQDRGNEFFQFQFQCGAIGSYRMDLLEKNIESFQFQCGAIGRSLFQLTGCCLSSFNSSVVRLVGYYLRKFQRFDYVSIPVWCDW